MLPQARSFLRAIFRRSRMEDDMRSELQSHMERHVEDLVAQGTPIDEATRRARIEFGTVDAIRDECRESVGLRWPLEIARDLKYAARILRKSPAFTLTAVATFALCIGVNTAIFSVVDSLLLRSLPLPQPDRLVTQNTIFRSKGGVEEESAVTGRMLEMLHESSALEVAGFAFDRGANLVIGTRAEFVKAQRVTAGFFHVLGVGPAIGREFTAAEDRVGGPPVAMLSYGLWMRLYNGDPGAVGRTVNIRGEPYTVVGIMPAGFRPPIPVELWTPLRPTRTGEGSGQNYGFIGRLRPGATWAQADSQVSVIGAAAYKEMELGPDVSIEVRAVPMQKLFTETFRTPLLVLWGAVIVVLVIGCVNIAGLLLVRGAGRRRELGTRMALGSGRGAVVRQLLSETILLAALGGAAGIFLGRWGLQALKLMAGKDLNLTSVALDGRVLLISACASLLTGLLFGLVPALQASRVDIRNALVEGGARGAAGGGQQWTRRGLVIAEVALGVVLLVVAGLLIRTFAYLHDVKPGFDARNVLTANISLQDARYATTQSVNRLFDESTRRIGELPGVQAVAVALSLPYERTLNTGFTRLDGPHAGKGSRGSTNLIYVTPDYFAALRIPHLEGRLFTSTDNAGSQQVAVVTQSFAGKYLGEQTPVGSHINVEGSSREIIGVVGNVQQSADWNSFIPSARPSVFIPAAQAHDKFLQVVHRWFTPVWIVRTSGGQEGMIAGIQRAVQGADPQLPIASFRGMDEVVSQSLAGQRFQTVLLSALAALALLLAAVGIYGLIANSVVERTRELGIRMALGATTGQAMRAVVVPGIALAMAGVGLGCVLARASVGVVEHLIFGVRTTDTLTFILAACCLLLATAVASVIPALRVTRLNPADTLRAE
jgi:predicted permease